MPGQAVVVIRDKEWVVSMATTPQELLVGLSGVESIPAGTGMLFDLGAEQIITVTAENMLFPVSVIFIDSNLKVTEVALLLMPGDFGTTSLPARYFLEVNVGEAVGIEDGDAVSITITQAPGFDWSSIIVYIMPLVVLGLVFPLITGMLRKERRSDKHYSIPGEPHRRLVEKYGSWAVGRAESVCPEGDVECVEREAARLLGAYRRGFGA